MNRESILKEAKEIFPYAVKIREQLHKNPELSFQEYRTALVIEQELTAEKIPYTKVGKTGIVAVIEGLDAKLAGTIALRTDMDALSIREETNLPFQSNNGNMHACGHDLHMAMVLAAAKVMNRRKESLRGNVKLIFQPAEEIGQGARAIIDSGEIQDADTILALHMNPQEKVGFFHTGYGARTSAGCCIDLILEGSKEVLVLAAAQLINSISKGMPELFKTEYPYAFSPTVVGSTDENHFRISYDGRIFTAEDSRNMEGITRNLASAVEEIYPVKISIQVKRIGDCVQNHGESVDQAVKVVSELFGEASVKITPPAMFGEDFRCYSEITKKLVFSTLGGSVGTTEYPLHSSRVEFSNDAMLYGIAYYLGYIEVFFDT